MSHLLMESKGKLRSYLLLALLLFATAQVATAECDDPADMELAAQGRHLLDHDGGYRGCYYEKKIKFPGPGFLEMFDIESPKDCCKQCKIKSQCLSWSWRGRDGRCKLKKGSPGLRYKDDDAVSGTLRWRPGYIDEPDAENPAPPAPEEPNPVENPYEYPGLNFVWWDATYGKPEGSNDDTRSTPSPSPTPDHDEEPTSEPIPDPPSPEPVISGGGSRASNLANKRYGKAVGGKRLNSYLPCKENIADSPDTCSKKCINNGECTAWTFASTFNCGWAGETSVEGLCYLMSDSEDSEYDHPEGNTMVSGWT